MLGTLEYSGEGREERDLDCLGRKTRSEEQGI